MHPITKVSDWRTDTLQECPSHLQFFKKIPDPNPAFCLSFSSEVIADRVVFLMANPTYNLSFTSASLRPELARIVAEVYLTYGDWKKTKQKVLSNNLLQMENKSSLARFERELRYRLQHLSKPQLELLANGNSDDRLAMAWLGLMKHTAFAYDFVGEVLAEKLESGERILRESDYKSFVESKALLYPQIEKLSDSTLSKVRRTFLFMLKEVGLLGEGDSLGMVQRVLLTDYQISIIEEDDPQWLKGYLHD